MNINDLLTRFNNVKQLKENSYQVSCPTHADDEPSLTVTDETDRFLLHCKAGCETESIVQAIGLEIRDLFKDNDTNYQDTNNKPKNSNIDVIYPYVDLEGNVLFEKVRFKGSKGIFRHTDTDGNVIWSISKGTYYETFEGSGEYSSKKEKNKNNKTVEVKDNIDRILYNLPALIEAKDQGETLYICEGEKDVETLKEWGLVATCNFDGGGKDKFKKKYGKYFLNADVVVIPDCDKAGADHQQTIINNLFDLVKSIKVIELPNVRGKKGFDLTDYVEVGHTKEEFLKMVEETEEVQKNSVDTGDKPSDTGIEVFVYNGCYAKHTKNGIKNISNFIISVKEIIVNKRDTQIRADFISCKGYKSEKTFDINSLNTRRNFLEIANDIHFSFIGTDNDLQELKQIISLGDFKELIGVDYIGFNKIDNSNVFITNTKAIDEELNVIDDIVITEDKTVIKSDILEVEPITKEELKVISPALFNFNKLEVTSSILGSISTMMIKERLKSFDIKTQHLMLFGEAGAGKSETMSQIIAPFFSYESSIVSSAGITRFTAIKNITSSNTIPLLLEEYKPSEMSERQKDMLLELFRNIYDGHSEQRGNRDQTITDYPLLSPIVAVGEEQVEQTAVIERSIITTFSKLESTKEDRTNSYLKLKENKHLMQKLGRSILNVSLQITDEELKDFMSQSSRVTNELFKGRVKQNVTNTITGLQLIIKVFEDLGLNIEEETQIEVNSLINAVNNNVFLENLEGTSNTKTIIDNTLEVIDIMTSRGYLEEGINYTYINKKTELALNVKSFFDDVTRYKSDFKVGTNIVGTQKQFTKMLRSTDYFIGYKPASYVNESNPSKQKVIRSYVLDINKLKEKGLDLDNLI